MNNPHASARAPGLLLHTLAERVLNTRDLTEFVPSQFEFLFPQKESDELLECVTTNKLPARLIPLLVHEYTHVFASHSPLCRLYSDTARDYIFACAEYVFSGLRQDHSSIYVTRAVADTFFMAYINFWQEGLAAFAEFSSSFSDCPDRTWADSLSAFTHQITRRIGPGHWTSADHDTAMDEQRSRLSLVLSSPVPKNLRGSYLIEYLLMQAIYREVKARIPSITCDEFIELMRCILFFDRSVWEKVAHVLCDSNDGNGSTDQLASKLRSCFEHGCKGVEAFILDIRSLKEHGARELLHRLRERHYASGGEFAKVSLPILRQWSARSDGISDAVLEATCDRLNQAAFGEFKAVRVASTRFTMHNQRFDTFDWFDGNFEIPLLIIDSRGVLGYEADDMLTVYFDPLAYIKRDSSPLQVSVRDCIYKGPKDSGLLSGRFYLFMIQGGSMHIGWALFGEKFGLVRLPPDESLTSDIYIKVYRSLLLRFALSYAYTGEYSERFQEFEARRHAPLQSPALDWTKALAALIDMVDKEPGGLGSIRTLIGTGSFCPVLKKWFGGEHKAFDNYVRSHVEAVHLGTR